MNMSEKKTLKLLVSSGHVTMILSVKYGNSLVWRRNKENINKNLGGFPGGEVVENLPANAGDTGSSPGPGRSHVPRSN